MSRVQKILAASLISALGALPALATTFTFSTGSPDGRMAVLSQPGSAGKIETEAADDFILPDHTVLTSGSFTGLVPAGATIQQVDVEIYQIFPVSSLNPPSGNVPTRVNSPSDVELQDRGTLASTLSFTTTLLDPTFTVANTVVNGIHSIPSETTGGEGPATGQEVQFIVSFSTPIDLQAGHYFFVPQVQLSGTNTFLWLSTAEPPLFTGDLQAWVRNANLAPDWLRVGTDIVGGTTPPRFDMSFSLVGNVVPEPCTIMLFATGLGLIGPALRKRFTR